MDIWLHKGIHSFKVGKDVLVTLCGTPFCKDITHDHASEAVGPIEVSAMANLAGWSRGVILTKWKKPSVMVFREKDCQVGFTGVFTHGDYNSKDLNFKHVGAGQAKGIQVGKGLTVTMYSGDNFTGHSHMIKGPVRICDGWGKDFKENDLRSMKVQMDSEIKNVGKWV